ncbi:hypothetical protein V3N00_15870 [Acinetobacter baumannii]|uniref:hypothetical protein n=1 Tax=Acinetobacter baumannii TaxID=470 RepID=UPI002F3298D9
MSEFKKGDVLVNKTAVNTGTIELIYEHKYYFHGFSKDFGIITISKKKLDRYRKATKTEEEAGHRIDKPNLPEPIGSLQELHPEFAKVLHENFLELLGDESNTVQMAKDAVEHGHGFAMVSIEGVEQVSIAHVINPFPCEELGDDFPIENRISPLCKSKDV